MSVARLLARRSRARPTSSTCPCCGRRLREYLEQLVVDHLAEDDRLETTREVADELGVPVRVADRILRRGARPGGPFERAPFRAPWQGRPWFWRLRRGWRP